MKRPWHPAELAQLREQYPHMPTRTIAAMLERSERAVYMQADLAGLRKTRDYIVATGRARVSPGFMAAQFGKGLLPWNKGKSHPAGRNRTNFKPGNRPQTWKPIGSERRDKDGVLMRKVADTRVRRIDWRPVHALLWEAAQGPIPRGCFVVFKDRNRDNFALDNLELVDRRANMKRNSYHRFPQPIPQLIQLRGALQRQINRKDRRGRTQD